MPTLVSRRTSLCLFCEFAARTRLQPQRLLPRTQVAHRATTGGGEKNSRREKGVFARISGGERLGYRGRVDKDGSPGYPDFFRTVRNQMEKLRDDLNKPGFLQSLHMDRGTFDSEWETFERSVSLWIKRASPELINLARGGFKNKKSKALESRLRYLFYAQVYGGRFTKAEQENQKQVADLRYPAEWYPATREIRRTVHLHVGPTNSGKTYHALKRLEAADRGIYLGPLRLLAHEVYTRLNAKGKACALVTGEEQRLPDGDVKMWSCTVEMAPLNTALDVAVIDEIQMINHNERGWAWTSAFLGVQAREVHLCGEARTVPIIKELCALVGDKVEVHEYERLTPLEVAKNSLKGNLGNLEKGDCIVAFSVLGLHALRREVEMKTGKKCAIVYGSLPPETRAQQARLFNDPENDYDFLVASDAIGMGLNLSIKRVIFESTMKNNGSDLVPLKISEVKQIGGRAGRYRSAHQAVTADMNVKSDSAVDPVVGLDDVKGDIVEEKAVAPPAAVGLVTTLDRLDFDYLASAMKREPEPIETAGLSPPSQIVERFASYFPPGTPFSYIMLRLNEISVVHPRFHLCALKDQLAIADVIHTVKNLSIADRIMICATPSNMRDEGERNFLRALGECIADNKSGELLDLPNLPLEVLDQEPTAERKYLYSLEQLHKMIVAYMWLSYRFPHVFTTRTLANHVKQITEDAIERTLMQFSWSDVRNKRKQKREEAMRELQEQEKAAAEERKNIGIDLPEEARQILGDKRSFDDSEAPIDDEGEYHPEELDDLEPTPAVEQQRTQLTRKDSDNRQGQTAPAVSASDAPQPRL
ncbi:RNA helicase [Didymosphaeria variabile]|uniref:RNA helicase n=1 Tax=Didymosphaeria variabile TaxID=1932322 RepID=A0A9W9C9X3_9PLEO|nr:RNA helicase [Didymosphaeria variabile]KAJ4351507.1 RNA helicase [Didymosphaeria variabile]